MGQAFWPNLVDCIKNDILHTGISHICRQKQVDATWRMLCYYLCQISVSNALEFLKFLLWELFIWFITFSREFLLKINCLLAKEHWFIIINYLWDWLGFTLERRHKNVNDMKQNPRKLCLVFVYKTSSPLGCNFLKAKP